MNLAEEVDRERQRPVALITVMSRDRYEQFVVRTFKTHPVCNLRRASKILVEFQSLESASS